MPPPNNQQNAALLAHIAAQTRANLDFLVSQNYIPAGDVASVSRVLAGLGSSSAGVGGGRVDALSDRTESLALNEPRATPPSGRAAPPPPIPAPIRTPSSRLQKARALWDYAGDDTNDLSFGEGDVIEIVKEDNNEWWTGRLNGREGIFPANYVEKISSLPSSIARNNSSIGALNAPSSSQPYFPSPSPSLPRMSSSATSPAPAYSPPPMQHHHQPHWQSTPPPPQHWQPPPPPMQSYYGPPPPQQIGMGMHNEKPGPGAMVYAPPPMPPQQQQQQAPPPQPQEPKKNRFGGLGNTLASSAAGGLGFGAGAAVGGGIINSIF